MTNTELIKTLRWCGSEDERHEMCVDESYRCPMWNEDRMTDYCKADLMLDAADAFEAAEKRIAELEKQHGNQLTRNVMLTAQLPKEGVWIEQDDGNSIYHKCSVCGKNQYNVLLEMMQGDYHYCPNCGARMRTVTDCHTLESER